MDPTDLPVEPQRVPLAAVAAPAPSTTTSGWSLVNRRMPGPSSRHSRHHDAHSLMMTVLPLNEARLSGRPPVKLGPVTGGAGAVPLSVGPPATSFVGAPPPSRLRPTIRPATTTATPLPSSTFRRFHSRSTLSGETCLSLIAQPFHLSTLRLRRLTPSVFAICWTVASPHRRALSKPRLLGSHDLRTSSLGRARVPQPVRRLCAHVVGLVRTWRARRRPGQGLE